MDLSPPSTSLAKRCCEEFQNRTKYRVIEESLSMLFGTWPNNCELETVHLKVVALNAMYSTQIYDTLSASIHVHSLQIDDRLSLGDQRLVADIANMQIGGKLRVNTSFASKYCCWHRPDDYYIYDSYVDEALWYFHKTDGFADFLRKDLKDYGVFSRVLQDFSEHYELQGLSNKQIDQYLWIQGERLLDS